MSNPILNVTSADIIKVMSFDHKYGQNVCKICGERTGNCAAVYVVYATEVCNCDQAPYEHLIEVPYHVECFATIAEKRGEEAKNYKAAMVHIVRRGRPLKSQ